MPTRPNHRRRWILALCAAATPALAGCTPHDAEVMRSNDQREIDAAVHWLSTYGAHPTISTIGDAREPIFIVRVDASEEIGSRALLHQLELPRAEEPEGESIGMLPTPADDRLKLIRSRQAELSAAMEMDSRVIAARVHLVLPPGKEVGRSTEQVVPQASVMIKYVGDADPNELASMARTLVAHGVDGISSVEQVGVTTTRVDPARIELEAERGDNTAALRTQRNTLGFTSGVLLLAFVGALTAYLRGFGQRA